MGKALEMHGRDHRPGGADPYIHGSEHRPGGLDPIGESVNVNRHLSTGTSADSTIVKTTAGTVHGWYISNTNASVRYVKLYNKASSPAVGTDTPFMTIPIPGGAAANVEFANGIDFTTGIGFGITTAVADASSAAVAANEIVINLLYL